MLTFMTRRHTHKPSYPYHNITFEKTLEATCHYEALLETETLAKAAQASGSPQSTCFAKMPMLEKNKVRGERRIFLNGKRTTHIWWLPLTPFPAYRLICAKTGLQYSLHPMSFFLSFNRRVPHGYISLSLTKSITCKTSSRNDVCVKESFFSSKTFSSSYI